MLRKIQIVILIFAIMFSVGATNIVQAATLTDAQIQAIVALLQSFGADQGTVQNVRSVLSGEPVSSNTSSPQPQCLSLLHTLYLDVSDATTDGEVTKLQQFLAKDPSIYPEGRITGYFGPATEKAVRRWQARNGVVSSGSPDSTGYGYVGPKTRSVLSWRCTSISQRSINYNQQAPPTTTPTTDRHIKVVYPNGGEILDNSGGKDSGIIANITWVSSGTNGTAINIGLTDIKGNIIEWIGTGVRDMGSFSWKYNQNIPNGKYKISVSLNERMTDIEDRSDDSFILSGNNNVTPPIITSGSYDNKHNVFRISGSGFILIPGSTLHYKDTLSLGRIGVLTNINSFSTEGIDFYGDLYTGNMASVYSVKFVDPTGRTSNEITIDTRTSTIYPAPVIKSVNGKGGFGTGDNDSIYGENLWDTKEVYLLNNSGIKIPLTYSAVSNAQLHVTIPALPQPIEAYVLYVVTQGGSVSYTIR